MARSAGRAAAGGTFEQQTESSLDGSTVTRLQECRVDQLISRIKPAQHSEQRRNFVARHVKGLISKCFQPDHEVPWPTFIRFSAAVVPFLTVVMLYTAVLLFQVNAFIFGSVPLKTYLPDGDIDLSLFLKSGPGIRDTWTIRLAKFLESEQGKEGACRIGDVQVVNAEVKLISRDVLCASYIPRNCRPYPPPHGCSKWSSCFTLSNTNAFALLLPLLRDECLCCCRR